MILKREPDFVMNPKDAIGALKPGMSAVPVMVLQEIGVAMMEGARKYGSYNYRIAGIRASVYIDAARRHMDYWVAGEDIDPDSGLNHITKALASLVVLRDGMINNMVIDDRPPEGLRVAVHREYMQQIVDEIIKRHPESAPPYVRGDN